jgi:hypothetical protein
MQMELKNCEWNLLFSPNLAKNGKVIKSDSILIENDNFLCIFDSSKNGLTLQAVTHSPESMSMYLRIKEDFSGFMPISVSVKLPSRLTWTHYKNC